MLGTDAQAWRHRGDRQPSGKVASVKEAIEAAGATLSICRSFVILRIRRDVGLRAGLLVTLGLEHERPARAEREQGYSRTDLLDVWTPARPPLLAAPAYWSRKRSCLNNQKYVLGSWRRCQQDDLRQWRQWAASGSPCLGSISYPFRQAPQQASPLASCTSWVQLSA
jgi:hypothetical protein